MDNMHQDFDFNEGFQYPKPLVPSRNTELIRSEVNMAGPCCACKRSLGTITCGGCNAVKYCSWECQKYGSPWAGRHGWADHKDICNKIKKHRKETKDAIQALEEDFGGIDVLLRTWLGKEGLFKYKSVLCDDEFMGPAIASVLGEEFMGPSIANNQQEEYVLSRLRLTEAYAECGNEALSCTAFRLAAENMLDLFCLCYNKTDVEDDAEDIEDNWYVCCGWMVAAGMDQEALNYLCYFQRRQLFSIPYLDLSKDEDMEGDSYLQLLKDPKSQFDWSTDKWFHDYMLIALIKYKRLQYLLVQRQKDMAGWDMFMMGTHPRAGRASTIQKLRGNYLVIKKLQVYVMEEEIDFRIDRLNSQIEQILTAVNEENPFIIPVIIDVRSSPRASSVEEELSDSNPHWAYINYGYAWNMSTSYTRVLQKFLDTGHVLSQSTFLKSSKATFLQRVESSPVEGFLQAAFDVDPSRWYDLWNSNHGHVLSVVSRFIPRHFMATKNLQPHVDVLTSNHSHNLLNSHMGNDTDAALSAARLVAGNNHTAADILGNAAYKKAVRKRAVSSPQDQLLHNTAAAPSINQPFPGKVVQPVALARNIPQGVIVVPNLTAGPNVYNYEPTPEHSRITDCSSLAHQIPSARFEDSERGSSLSRNSLSQSSPGLLRLDGPMSRTESLDNDDLGLRDLSLRLNLRNYE